MPFVLSVFAAASSHGGMTLYLGFPKSSLICPALCLAAAVVFLLPRKETAAL